MKMPIADLHCDLLCYLGGNRGHTAHDLRARCSIPQLLKGAVHFQTLAIFAEPGKETLPRGLAQFEIFCQLPELYPNYFVHGYRTENEKIAIQVAFEGASTFCDEKEPIQQGLERFKKLSQRSKPLYVSMTWNEENRFGGGAHSSIGLKKDGKLLLDTLHKTGIALDLSHTSDALARDSLNYIDKKNLDIKIIASHSNYRSITSVARNLPDDIAKEILNRKGLIGINLYKKFIGDSPLDILKHVEQALKLGGVDHIAFGADFFFEEDLPVDHRKAGDVLFFPDYSNATCYEKLLHLFQSHLDLDNATLEKIAYKNVRQWLIMT